MPAEPKEPRTRLIEVTTELMDTFGGRTLDGWRLSYEWGEATAFVTSDGTTERGVYAPTITATDDGWLREQRDQAAAESDLRLLVMTTARDAAVVEADRLRELLAKVEGLAEEVRAMLDTHACFQTDPPLIGVIELRRRLAALAALPDDGREGLRAALERISRTAPQWVQAAAVDVLNWLDDERELCDATLSDGWSCTRLPNHEGVHQ